MRDALLSLRFIESAGSVMISSSAGADRLAQEKTMANKEQKRSNREAKKPKKKKEIVLATAGMSKGILASPATSKKKG